MIQIIVKYLQNILSSENIFQKVYGLTEQVEVDGKTFPLFYDGNGKFNFKFEPKKWYGVAYFRKSADITFSDTAFPSAKPCETPISVEIPLKFVCSIQRNKISCDDNYSGDNLAFYVAKLFQDINSIRRDLQAYRVTYSMGAYKTNAMEIFSEELEGLDVKYNPEFIYLSMDLNVNVQTTKECMFDICGGIIIDEQADAVIDQIGDNLTA